MDIPFPTIETIDQLSEQIRLQYAIICADLPETKIVEGTTYQLQPMIQDVQLDDNDLVVRVGRKYVRVP